MVAERRGFLATVFSFLFTEKAAAPPPPKLKGFLVFTINVGQLPPYKAEAFIERLKDKMVAGRQDPEWQIIMLPVRNQDTKFEVIAISPDQDTGVMEAKRLKAWELLAEHQEEEKATQEYPTLEQTTDYVLLHLGAPVVKIELDQQQIELCYDKAVEEIEESPYVQTKSTIMDGALAYAKIILGRIRCKYIYPTPEGSAILDGPSLLSEGERDLLRWRNKIETA